MQQGEVDMRYTDGNAHKRKFEEITNPGHQHSERNSLTRNHRIKLVCLLI